MDTKELIKKLQLLNMLDKDSFMQLLPQYICPNEANMLKDRFGRAMRNNYQLSVLGLDNIPIMDEANIFYNSLKPRLPHNKKAIVCLSHDVDQFDSYSYYWLRQLNWYSRLLKSRLKKNYTEAYRIKESIKTWGQWKEAKYDPVFVIDEIMDIEAEYEFRSTFFFLSLEKSLSREGRLYSIYDKRVRSIIRKLHEGGWEIGLHGSYYRNFDVKNLINQRKRLEDCTGSAVRGCRHHYLRVTFPKSWRIYREAGFIYSSNMGWSEYNGFRAGTSWPYQPNEGGGLWEIPFHIMDNSFQSGDCDLFDNFCNYLEKVKQVQGVMVIIVHSNLYNEKIAPHVYSFYNKVLKYLSTDDDVLVVPIRDVVEIAPTTY